MRGHECIEGLGGGPAKKRKVEIYRNRSRTYQRFVERRSGRLRQAKTSPAATVEAYNNATEGSGIEVDVPQLVMA